MSTFRLAIGIHNHQPVGNFQAVFDEAHRRAYFPFLDLVRQSPNLRISLHQSGSLWEWQKKAHPEFFRFVGKMIDSDQVELLTGGFYEPILVSIPERDIVGQIRKLSRYLRDHFEQTPRGFWPAERVWEPYLARPLTEAGVSYLPIDDTHFLYAGFEPNQLGGVFVTEHDGCSVRLLPIRQRLRYLIPFGTPTQIIDYLKELADSNPDGMAVYADDGEKFGIWPDTHAHCYDDGWLERFFEEIEKNSDWLSVVPLGEVADDTPVGRAYLPSASYAEMLHWSLLPVAYLEYENLEFQLKNYDLYDRFSRFIRGGHWRNFLTKYEEANFMHKKMQRVSERVHRFTPVNQQQIDRLAVARDRLFAGQCNCSYWHGVFGGLYLPHIRQAVYANLIEAEAILDQIDSDYKPSILLDDYTLDGTDDIIVSNRIFTAVFRPHFGAALIHLAMKKHNFDPTDTLTRRREGYHLKLDQAVVGSGRKRTESIHDRILAKEPGLKQLLTDDWYLKRCFIDHFLTPDVDFERFHTNRFGDEGDFVIEPYEITTDAPAGTVTFTRDGHLWRADEIIPLRLVKRFTFSESSDQVRITYELLCPTGHKFDVRFGIENNLNFQAGHAEDRFVLIDGRRPEESFLDAADTHPGSSSWALVDQHREIGVALISNSQAEIWRLPIFTVSQSESGFERVYQGTTLVNVYRLTISDKPTVISQILVASDSETIRDAVQSANRGVPS